MAVTMPNELDHTEPKEISVDLHGYPVVEAIGIATVRVKEAYENGFDFIEIIHGSPHIEHWMQAQTLGRGGIKWALRGILAR